MLQFYMPNLWMALSFGIYDKNEYGISAFPFQPEPFLVGKGDPCVHFRIRYK